MKYNFLSLNVYELGIKCNCHSALGSRRVNFKYFSFFIKV